MKYTQNVPDPLMAALREEHAYTYSQHRMKFGAWVCAILGAWLKNPERRFHDFADDEAAS